MIEPISHCLIKHRVADFLCDNFGLDESEFDDYEIEGFGDFLIAAHVLWSWARGVVMDDFLR